MIEVNSNKQKNLEASTEVVSLLKEHKSRSTQSVTQLLKCKLIDKSWSRGGASLTRPVMFHVMPRSTIRDFCVLVEIAGFDKN